MSIDDFSEIFYGEGNKSGEVFMGTALDSTEDRDDKKAIQDMVDEVKDDKEKNRDLQKVLGAAINEIVFRGQDIAPVRNKVKAAIAKQVKADVVSKFQKWKRDGSKPDEWPFKQQR